MRILFAMWTPSVWELGIILLLVLVLFGAGRLPDAFSQLGKAVKNFREAQKGGEDPLDVTPTTKRSLPKSEDVKVEEAQEIREKQER